LPEKPPILNLTERGGFYFDSGSIKLRPDFEAKLRQEVIPQIVRLGALYRATVIEVIGHTDGVPVRGGSSSLDQRLVAFLNGSSDETAPAATDNVGLGMGRAASVIRVLREDPQLHNMILLPLSAGQTTGPDYHPVTEEKSPVTPDEQRRRIEIRLRRHFGD
jgi:flagellar motor protein MotB